MDRIDQEILKILRKNPEMSFLAVARKVGLSSLTVQKRYEEMRKKKVFLGTTLMIDLSKIGLKGKAFLFITVSKDSNLREIVETFRQMSNMFLVVEVVGTFDLLAMVVFRDITDIMKVVDEVKVVPYVEKVEIALTNESFYPFREEYTEIIPFEEDTANYS